MIVASTESMNKLTSEQQQIVRECAQEAGQLQRKWMQEYDEKAIKAAEDAGCTITYLTKEQSAKFQSVAEPINENVSAKYMTIIRKIKAAQ